MCGDVCMLMPSITWLSSSVSISIFLFSSFAYLDILYIGVFLFNTLPHVGANNLHIVHNLALCVFLR